MLYRDAKLAPNTLDPFPSCPHRYAIQWFGQTYLLCAHKDDRSFGMSGRAFDASLFNIDTTPNGNPIAPPKNVTGEPLDCPKLEVIQRVRDSAAGSSTTSRRLTTGGNVLPMEYWFLESSEEEEDSIALAVTHGRMLGDDDDDECCNCRRRRLLETAQEAHGVRSVKQSIHTRTLGVQCGEVAPLLTAILVCCLPPSGRARVGDDVQGYPGPPDGRERSAGHQQDPRWTRCGGQARLLHLLHHPRH